MQGNSSGGGLVAAALILGASILGGAYMLTMSIDRGSAQLAGLNESLKTAAKAPAAAARPSAPSAPGRPEPGPDRPGRRDKGAPCSLNSRMLTGSTPHGGPQFRA